MMYVLNITYREHESQDICKHSLLTGIYGVVKNENRGEGWARVRMRMRVVIRGREEKKEEGEERKMK